MIVAALINDAYYYSGITSFEFETVSRSQSDAGLRLLNDLLSEKSISAAMIPYSSHTELTTQVGVAEYEVDNLVELQVLTFNDGTTRWPLVRDMQRAFFGSFRIDDIQSLLSHFYAERQKNKTIIYLYFLPNKEYTLNITGKYKLSSVVLDTDLSPIFDDFYTSYLKILLAIRLCMFMQVTPSPDLKKQLFEFNRELNKIEGADLSIVRPRMSRTPVPETDGRSWWNGWMP